MPKTVNVVSENQKYIWTKAWNASAPLANFAISLRRFTAASLVH
jgi:hypothetical protein